MTTSDTCETSEDNVGYSSQNIIGTSRKMQCGSNNIDSEQDYQLELFVDIQHVCLIYNMCMEKV
jgi:hypothetical protein